MQTQLYFTQADNMLVANAAMIDSPLAANVLTNPAYVEQHIIMPKYSFEGKLVNAAYTGLQFHFMVAPVFVNCVDFRLTDNNKYELLRFDDDIVANFSEEEISDIADEMEEAFEAYEEEPIAFALYEDTSEYVSNKIKLQIDAPCWCQYHYMRKKTDAEIAQNSDDDDEYTTDYDLAVFKDENGDTLQFVAELDAGDVFGVYYLFYSPTTRLVRQFFQCT